MKSITTAPRKANKYELLDPEHALQVLPSQQKYPSVFVRQLAEVKPVASAASAQVVPETAQTVIEDESSLQTEVH